MNRPNPMDSPEAWPTVSALLDEALDLPIEEREAWLQSLEGARAAHRETLRHLLSHASGNEASDFLLTLPPFSQATPPGPLVELCAGDPIGPYRLISELGTGGMGSVWLGVRADGTLKRKVALKLPRLAWATGLAERMARERDILATLEHPHIARLYDAGVDQHGRPFLALEYIEGQPIDAYASEQRLGVRDKLHLLLQVCSAVAFAHSRLVVHRDLKPANILVAADGQARLLDFGIAKLMQGDAATETQLTQFAGRALTLDYASPEQIQGGPIGTASDIYSLGVVAYELLTGARPYKLRRGSAAELEEAIATADARQASDAAEDPQVRKALSGDLDAILNKSLKKAAADRYASIEAFASDLRRHLASEPVSARPDSLRYRTARFVSRYRIAVAAASLVFATVTVAATAALLQAHEARLQRDRALLEADTAGEVSRFLVSLFEVPNPPSTDIVDRGRDRVLKGETPASEAVRARMLKVVGDLYIGIGQLEKSIAVYEEAIRLASLPDVADLRSEAEARVSIGKAMGDNGLIEAAVGHLARAVELSNAQAPDEADLAARAHLYMGNTLTSLGRFDEAQRHLQQALTLHTQLQGPQSRQAIGVRHSTARMHFRAGRQDLGLSQMGQALRDIKPVIGERDPMYMNMLDDYGTLLNQAERLAESRPVLVEALALRTSVYGPDHPNLTTNYGYLGHALVRAGTPVDAVPLLLRSIELEVKGNPRPTPYVAFQYEWLFRAYLRGGDVDRAESSLGRGLQVLKDAGEDPDSANHLRLHHTYVLEQLMMGRLAAAGQHTARLTELLRKHGWPTLTNDVLQQAWPPVAGRAEAAARRASLDALGAGKPSLSHRGQLLIQLTKANLAREGGDTEAARAGYEAALRLATGDFQRCEPQFLPAGLEWVDALHELGRHTDASAALERFRPCAEAMFESSPWRRRWQEMSRR